MHSRASLFGRVTGRVVDWSGAALSGARIAMRSPEHDWHEVEAGADGRFVIDPVLARPSVTFWIEADGHARTRLTDRCVFPGRVTDLGDLRAPKGTVVRFRVVDPRGQPIAGATVTCDYFYSTLVHTITADGPPRVVHSDADGRCVLPALGRSSCHARIKAPGYRTERVPLDPPAVDLGDVTLSDEPLVYEGWVTDYSDNALPGAEVWVRSERDHPARTDAEGRFRLECWDATETLLWAGKSGYSTIGLRVRDDEPLAFELDPLRWVHAHVTDARTGEPVAVDDVSLCKVLHHDDGTVSYLG